MAKLSIKGSKSVPSVGKAPSWVLGSRPGTLRAAPVPRIKPASASTTDYGKPITPNPGGAGPGDTATYGMNPIGGPS